MSQPQAKIVIIGGGPGGYEAALVAAQLGAAVTVVERDGLGGACVLTDCVPSKTLIASSARMAALDSSAALGIQLSKGATVDAPRLNARIRSLARASRPTWPGGWPRRACRSSTGRARWPGRTRW